MNTRIILTLFMALALVTGVSAATTCTFTTSGTTMTLDDDCTTDETLLIPDGYTLDGDGHTITAEDPEPGHFTGAVVMNNGSTADVYNVTVTTDSLANACDAGADRLRGIMFEGASGSITHTTVVDINQGPSGCQEGNAIEVRNAPFDGSHPDTKSVVVKDNYVDDYQKTGVLCNGDVECTITNNEIGDSATQMNLAANSVQLGFGALGSAERNVIYGNQWYGFDAVTSNFAASAVLVYLAEPVSVSQNVIKGNSDVGLFIVADGGEYVNNKLFDERTDAGGYDVGVWNFGDDNSFRNNKARWFETAYSGVEGGKNKVAPGPNGPNADNVFW